MTKKVGRPPRVFSELEIKQIEKLAPKLTKTQLADFFGISFVTLQQIEKRQPEVSEIYKRARASRIAQVVDKLFDLCMEGNPTMIQFFLRTQAGWKEESQETADIPPLQIVVDNAPDKAAV